MLFTDGAEDALRPEGHPRGSPIEGLIKPLLLKPRDELLLNVAGRMEAYQGNGQSEDDVTLLVMDIER
jgi:serine phosphatase RsbU (regulator of sigma subunit)